MTRNGASELGVRMPAVADALAHWRRNLGALDDGGFLVGDNPGDNGHMGRGAVVGDSTSHDLSMNSVSQTQTYCCVYNMPLTSAARHPHALTKRI